MGSAPEKSRWQTLVEVTRGPMVESRHDGAAVVTDVSGNIVAAWGEPAQTIYPRSAIKALQAMPIVETGAADAFDLGPEELALACGSHTGEVMHTARVAAWLDRIGCTVGDLACGSQWPMDQATRHAMIAKGERPSALHNNCSGKHAGMMSAARHAREPLEGYVGMGHPAQQRILSVLEAMTGEDLSAAPVGTDGCLVPTIAVSLKGLAVSMARMAAPDALETPRLDAVARITAAWSENPELMSGTGRFDTAINRTLSGRGMVKGGAEGVFCACIPALKLGLALKIADGGSRAAEVATAAILRKLDVLTPEDVEALSKWTRPIITDRAGAAVGEIRPVETL